MFSKRLCIPFKPNRLSKILSRLKKEGIPVIDLTESNPTRCQFTYPPDLLKPFANKRNLIYEPDPKGILEARKAIAQYYHQQGVKIDPDQIFLTASTSEAYHFLFRLLLNSGDHLLVPAPSYPLMEYLGRLDDIHIDSFDLEYEGFHWTIDFDALQKRIHSKTRAILLIHPNNPTGTYVNPEEQNRLIFLAKKRHLPIIADEVFFDYHYPEMNFFPGSFSSNTRSLTFTLNGLSKMVCLPQMKASWIIVAGPLREVKEAANRLELISDTYLSVNTPVQNALPYFLEKRKFIQSQVMKRILENRRILIRQLGKLPACNCLNSGGGWYAVIRLPRIRTDEDWALRILEKEGVLVYPGHFFEVGLESCLILSLLPPEPLFNAGIEKLTKRISKDLK